jgi:hypothetical protein
MCNHIDVLFYIQYKNVTKNAKSTTANGGSLGSQVDEERS